MEEATPHATVDGGAMRAVVAACAGYAAKFLQQNEAREALKLRCSERLHLEHGVSSSSAYYAEQAVLANLEWGVDGLESALVSVNADARSARLEHCQKLLQVPALLDPRATTAGVPNRYLSAWAHLYLALLFNLRHDDRTASSHLLEMFVVDPGHARHDFAPQLWNELFLPHTSNIQAWYRKERKKLTRVSLRSPSSLPPMDRDRSHSNNKSRPAPESSRGQVARMEILDKLYEDALDENTRHYARYYLEWLDNEDGLDSNVPADVALPRSPQSWSTSDSLTGSLAEIAQPPGDWRVSNNSMFNVSFQEEDRDSIYQDDLTKDISFKGTSFQEADADEADADGGISQESDNLLRSHLLSQGTGDSNPWDNLADTQRRALQPACTVGQVSDINIKEQTLPSGSSSMNSPTVYPSPGSSPSGVFSSASSDSSEKKARWKHFLGVHGRESRQVSPGTVSLSASLSKLSSELVELKSGPEHQGDSCTIKPPKHFVCPITHDLFENPVTLETGQTYERCAIQDWLDKGNKCCPLTQQLLINFSLPQTNSVLKGLVDAWKEEHSEYCREEPKGDAFTRSSVTGANISANALILTIQDKAIVEGGQWLETQENSGAKANAPCGGLDATLTYLDCALSELSSTEELSVWEEGVIKIAALWVEWKGDPQVEYALSNPDLVQRLLQLLLDSRSEKVLRASICLLCELSEENEFVQKALMERDPELKVLFQILTLGAVPQSAILLYLLKDSPMQQGFFEVIPLLAKIMEDTTLSWEGAFEVCWTPRAAATFLLEEMVAMCDNAVNMAVAIKLLSLGAVPALLSVLDSHVLEEKISAASILLSCIETESGCRNSIASGCKISSIVELLHCNKGKALTTGIALLVELIHVDRRSLATRILFDIQVAGHLSTMHVLLVYIQFVPLEERLQAAGLLLQIDLLVEPQMGSMFRDEALETLLVALACKENEEAQLGALKVLSSLTGRFTNSGECSIEARVLREAGYQDNHSTEVRHDDEEINLIQDDEEKMGLLWENRMATVLMQNGKFLFEALGMALSSGAPEVTTLGLGFAAWLSSALRILPDIGMVAVAAESLLPHMINILNSDCQIYELVLAAYCLESYMKNADTKEVVLLSSKELVGPLRQLKQLTWCAKELLRTLVDSSALLSHADMWEHAEIDVSDSSRNGEIRALAHCWKHLFSGHSDGSMKVWDLRSYSLLVVQEVKEHTRAVSCIAVSQSSSRLLSGSADKTVRVWLVEQGAQLKCVQVIDLKEVVQAVACSANWICIVPQASGIKLLLNDNTPVKLMNISKNVQSIVVADNKLYCGCTDSSLQVVDPGTGQVVAMQAGTRTLLGKKPIYAAQVYNEFLYTAGMPVDGLSAKVWNREDQSLCASFGSNADVRVMSVNEDFVYLGYNSSIEVWVRQKLVRVTTLAVGSRVTALALGGDILYSGSDDGQIRVWCLE